MASLDFLPVLPVPGDTISLFITGDWGEFGQFRIASKPTASAITLGPIVDAGGNYVSVFTPDATGGYMIEAHVYRQYAGIPAFAGDPAGERRKTLTEVLQLNVQVGKALYLPIRALGHQVSLRLVVQSDSESSYAAVVAASLVNPTTERARLASLDGAVASAVTGLLYLTTNTLGENLTTEVAVLRTAFSSHIANGAVHAGGADATNIPIGGSIGTLLASIAGLNSLQDKVLAHMSNNGGGFHTSADRRHLPVAAKAFDNASATVLLADLRRRVLGRHVAATTIGSDVIHSGAGSVSADSPLTSAIVAVLDYFAAHPPAAPTGENAGAADLLKYGFSKEN